MFLIVTDAYFKWIEVKAMNNITAKMTVTALRFPFAQHGLYYEIVTDNDPAWTSAEFKEYMKYCGVKHILVAPYHPSSNRAA